MKSELLFRAELARITDRFEAADCRAKRAAKVEDREAAEWERLEAAGDFTATEMDLADLLLMLLRLALKHQPAALAQYLGNALRDEFEPLVDAVISLEARRQ
jgi:hypothetical protein